MNLLRLKLDRKTLETIYIAFVRPVLEYSDVVFDNCTTECKDLLESLQKRAGKIVTGAIRGTPSNLLYAELSWETLQTRRTKHEIMLFSKITHNNVPSYLSDHLPAPVHERTRYNLRNQNDITLYPSRTNIFNESFSPRMTRTWNNMDDRVKQITDSSSLRRHLNSTAGKKNSYYYLGSRKFQIIMSRIRMFCSDLALHLHEMHIIDNPLCSCGIIESSEHYFLDCPLFIHSRNILRNKLQSLNHDLNLDIILHGIPQSNNINNSNKSIAFAVDEYLSSTHRFPLFGNNATTP